ncbi:MAG: TIGR01777 family oxidoreductase [Gammaproteobacteria bacterium]|nr:TIGR01777 family oxidoreductase [Gammaproteobacteria bacterium]
MNILISGASGLIGTALTDHLRKAGHHVIPLARNASAEAFTWQPANDLIKLDETTKLDVVINLAGPGVADKRWSSSRKSELLNARVNGTRLLSEALAQRAQKPKLFISASAIGFYGPRDDQAVDESNESGSGFLAEISRQWEAATSAAQAAGIRTVHARFGIVLSGKGGALKRMLLPFKLGLGGVIGSGKQGMSWISMHDLVSIIVFLIGREDLSGAFNLVAPNPVSNREFTRALGRVLGRPTLVPMPAFQARLLFGEMAEEILLTGARVLPTRLLDAGFEFSESDLEQALRAVLNKQ